MRLGLSSYRVTRAGGLAVRRVSKASRPERDERDRLEALARKAEPALAKLILEALKAHPGLVDVDALEEAIRRGNIEGALAALNNDVLAGTYKTVSRELSAIAWAAGSAVPALTGTAFVFDHLNPALIDWLRTYTLGLIQEMNDQTLAGVRSALVRGMNAGQGPRETARDVRQVIGLTEYQEKAVARFRSELKGFHLRRSAKAWNLGGKIDRAPGGAQVFKPDEDGSPKDEVDARRLRDFRFDATLKRAMEKKVPLTQAQIDKMVDRYAERYRKHRSEVIARTESMRATNMGAFEAWKQAILGGKVDQSLVRRQWLTAKDERLCRTCQPVPGMNPARGVKFDQPFQTPKGPVQIPPLHPNCRCSVFNRVWEPSQLASPSAGGYKL